MSDERHETYATMAGILWFMATLVLIALFVSAAAQGELTIAHVILASVILGLAVSGSIFFLHRLDQTLDVTKTKRQHVDHLLNGMTDEELRELKRRLSDVDLGRTEILDHVGDDGEMTLRG